MSDQPQPVERPSPVRLPHERLTLPGVRAAWWLLVALSLVAPLSLHLLSPTPPAQEQADGLTAELRGRTFLWRLMSNTQPQLPAKPIKAPPTEPGAAKLKEAEDADWRDLAAHARKIDREHGVTAADAREQLIVHALAVEHPERAVALAAEVSSLSLDVRALLTGLPDAPTASVLDPKSANLQMHDRTFGKGWSAYQRDHARQLAYERQGDIDSARLLNKSLQLRDSRLVPTWSAAALLFLIALLVGGFFWIGTILRHFGGPPGTHAARDWLLSRYPGLPRDLPYITDPIIPWLGFGGWLTGYLLASLALAAMAGQRSMSGLGVLFQAGVGAMVAIGVVQTFARRTPGVPHAARLSIAAHDAHDPPQISLPAAFLAAIRVLAALLPVMVVVVLLLALFGIATNEHPVSGLVFADADPLQLAAIGVSVAVLAPLGEELIFRGFLYRALRMRLGVLPTLFITSLAFSALHPSFGPYFVLSAAFCLAYEWTGSLWTSILLHGLWNGLSFALLVGVAIS